MVIQYAVVGFFVQFPCASFLVGQAPETGHSRGLGDGEGDDLDRGVGRDAPQSEVGVQSHDGTVT